jgi:capsular polysaccharide biosynthesis protein
MHDASVIVGMHGAGLSNMIWARRPCRVVEIFPTNYYNDCFARLALTCGYDYQMTKCDKGRSGTSGRIPIGEIVSLAKLGV